MTKKTISAGVHVTDKTTGDSRIFQTGQILFRQGSPVSAACLIRSGKVGIYREEIDGHKIKLAEIGPGEILGEMALLSNKEIHSVTAELLEDSIVILITRDYIEKCFQESPPVLKNIVEGLIQRLYQSNNLVEKLSREK